METKIISAFPGCGKTYMFENQEKYNKKIIEIDKISIKEYWKNNFINEINKNIGKVDIIFIPINDEYLNILNKNNIPYILIYPNIELFGDYLERCGNNKNIKYKSYWFNPIEKCINNKNNCLKIQLNKGEYISDIIL